MRSLPILLTSAVLWSVGSAGDLERLGELTYQGVLEHEVTLSDGVWKGESSVEGDASRPVVRLADLCATGDLGGDGADETAVLLISTSEGRGTLTHLAIVDDSAGEPANTATESLGDRLEVIGMAIVNGYVQLDLAVPGPADPACCPGRKARRSYGLEGGRLREVFAEELGALTTADLAGTTWRLIHLEGEGPLADIGITARLEGRNLSGSTGCNRYFAALTPGDGRSLSIAPPASTRRSCPERPMRLERSFLEALESVASFGFETGRLVLFYPTAEGPSRLLFRPTPESIGEDD